MKPGTKVVCIDGDGWLVAEDGPSPRKDGVYTVREYERFGSVGAVSLLEFHPENFYRACRFRPVEPAPMAAAANRQPEPACA